MKDIKINNENIIGYLNEFKDFIFARWESGDLEKELPLNCKSHKDRNEWTSDEYLKKVIDMGKDHEGFPDSMRSFTGIMPDNGSKTDPDQDWASLRPYREMAEQLNRNLMSELSAKKNTLVTVYPPGGWISWHNNANAAGYNIIFSWSETGDGWFDYWDLEKQERIRVQDVPGWQCKMGYFGAYHQPDRLCYHTAATDCLRISVAYVFAEAEDIWEQIIEDIEEPL